MTSTFKLGGGRTPLQLACAWGSLELIKVLVSYGADLNTKTIDGDTPLTLAAANKHYECVMDIIKMFDCNLNIRGNEGRTLLHCACADGKIDLVHLLVQNKADLSIREL